MVSKIPVKEFSMPLADHKPLINANYHVLYHYSLV